LIVDWNGPKDADVQSYLPGGASVPLYLLNNNEPSVYGGDVPYGKLL